MRRLIFSILFFITNCDDVEQLSYYCENKVECWIPPDTENTQKNIIFNVSDDYKNRYSFCGTGYTICENEDVKCVGITYATEEKCDGLDNDCNGIIDDPQMFYLGSINMNCYNSEIGQCRYSEQYCINGELVCLHETAPGYGVEVCDGKDNDCDGDYDEDVPQTFVYTGSYDTVNVGECKAGITVCEDGKEQIFGMVLPTTEICLNNKDDDCDGLIDEVEGNTDGVDYAFLIDFSGSMDGERLDSVLRSVCSFVDNPIFALSRFAMVGVSVDGFDYVQNNDQYSLYVITDFTDIGTACNELDAFMSGYVTSNSVEYQTDGILRLFGNYQTSLSWSDNDRRIYVFTDEPAQCLACTTEQVISDISESCNVNNFILGIFTVPEYSTEVWYDVISSCNGFIEDIDNLSSERYFEDNFLIWFGASC